MWRRGWRSGRFLRFSSTFTRRCGLVALLFCTGRDLACLAAAAATAALVVPFGETFFQHQASGWEFFFIRGADGAASLAGRVGVSCQRSDKRVEDVLEEGHDGRTVGVVIGESDLEA